MEIILTQDITGIGYKDDMVKVKAGYARNYLIPKGMAVLAVESKKKELAEQKKQRAFKEEKIRKEAENIAKALENTELTIGVKAGTSGKIFGSVNNIMVANAIQEQKKIEIDRKTVILDEEHIKEIGKYTARIKLHKDIEVEINLDVVAE
jgi:large subunit ribosomal protein L9